MENIQCFLKKCSSWVIDSAFKQFTYFFQLPLDFVDLGLAKSLSSKKGSGCPLLALCRAGFFFPLGFLVIFFLIYRTEKQYSVVQSRVSESTLQSYVCFKWIKATELNKVEK